MRFKDFQAPVLFSSTFKALNLGEKNSSTFKDFEGCVEYQATVYCTLSESNLGQTVLLLHRDCDPPAVDLKHHTQVCKS